MIKRIMAAAVCLLLVCAAASAQDAKTVIANASKAMGLDGVNSVVFYGSGANFGLGQSNNANGQWPRTNISDYVRAIDFTQPASRATAVTYSAPVTGGAATQGAFNQNITPANNAWAQHLEIWITPWGFLKGAAANGATVKSQTISGKRFQVVSWNSTQKSPSGLSYPVVGYINAQNLVEKVETKLENPIFGDMVVEGLYSEYRTAVSGLKYPAFMVQTRGGAPTFEAQILGARANPTEIQQLLTPPATPQRGGGGVPAPPAGGPPAGAGGRGAAPGAPAGGAPGAAGGQRGGAAAAAPVPPPTSEKLADGVWRIIGAYNALAVEFADHIVLFEGGPQNEMRAQQIIAEAKRVIPNKPIRYSILSHHHFDHSSGLPAVVAEGATIITHDVNKAFLERALSAPRTLASDSMSKSGKKPKVEGIVGDKRVLQDATRTVEIHLIQGLPHADGLLVAYLPRERILVYADMFNLPVPLDSVPNPPVVGTQVFLANIERLQLNPERVMSVHSLNPDRMTTVAEIRKSLGR